MRNLLILSVSAVVLAGFGAGFAAVMAQEAPIAVDYNAAPVFPSDAPRDAGKAPVVAPKHATHRVSSNGKTFRFVACRESRDVRGTQERRCVTWNARKGWAKSAKWVPAYQLLSLTGPLPQ
ncbi:MAG: hypothetical protein E6Q97_32635 [Desulfurellales bacterium]|nr:MAG: hypothetical protein E6Q97_32635 [Desulfurellales bacterium]